MAQGKPVQQQVDDTTLNVKKMLGKWSYDVVHQLGFGNQSDGVWLVYDRNSGEEYAVKIVPRENLQSAVDVAKQEAELMREFKQGNHIIGFHKADPQISENHLCLFMEYFPGAH